MYNYKSIARCSLKKNNLDVNIYEGNEAMAIGERTEN